ncbi:NAD(P)/FAD-dependent oxidoreductase [Roseococcus sp. DSY-14]|uniref:NAD(P)/FAD-dependent oxidoreductase n=1 Tax=Roseococcus sp. DSY-14 TaxID=3369650 RepID=UPI00387B4892
MSTAAVIGGGILGACLALELQDAGHAVTLIEPGPPGGAQAASYGNAAWISPGSIIPPATPGLWRKLPGFLRDPLGPVSIRPARLPAATPWLARYLLSGWTEAQVRRTATALRGLLRDAPARHAALAARAGRTELIRQDGLLYPFPDRAAFTAEALAWRIRAELGLRCEELDAAALREAEPELSPRYGFGVLVGEGAHCRDPGGYVAVLTALAEARGAHRVAARATAFRVEAGRLRAVLTDVGEVPADRAVLAAGIHSAPLVRLLGSRVPLESERGYHAVFPEPGIAPRRPVMPSDGKMGITLTEGGLRVAGQVQIAGLDAAPDWRRAEILAERLRGMFPRLQGEGGQVWMGHRPSTPDGLPVIGPARATADVWLCFGHGHVGLAAAPASAALAVEGMRGAPVPPAFAPSRFG